MPWRIFQGQPKHSKALRYFNFLVPQIGEFSFIKKNKPQCKTGDYPPFLISQFISLCYPNSLSKVLEQGKQYGEFSKAHPEIVGFWF